MSTSNPFNINLEPMFDLSRVMVIDPIPENRRAGYYLRGAAVGALALNLWHGVNRVNPTDDLWMHVKKPATPDAQICIWSCQNVDHRLLLPASVGYGNHRAGGLCRPSGAATAGYSDGVFTRAIYPPCRIPTHGHGP